MIVVRNLTKDYGRFRAVDDLTLTVRGGEVYGFLGPNGAGKTTTIRILVGLARPTRGSVEIAGHDIAHAADAAKRAIGFVPDRPFLYEKLSGLELARIIGRLYGAASGKLEDRIRHYLDYFDLAAAADDPIESYSYGMKQKLSFVAALAHDPEVLIIDEPMVGLDALAQRKMRQLLSAQAGAGKTVLLTTHNLSVAEEICDRVGIIHLGKLLAEGTLSELSRLRQSGGKGLEELFLALTFPDAPMGGRGGGAGDAAGADLR